MCSVPVRAIDIFNSKIAVNLTVICPFVLISAILLGFKMEVSFLQAVLLFIVPAVYACFISVLGMYMNVKFPKYDWTSEYYAVKGGAISVLATMGSIRYVKQFNTSVCLHCFSEYKQFAHGGNFCFVIDSFFPAIPEAASNISFMRYEKTTRRDFIPCG